MWKSRFASRPSIIRTLHKARRLKNQPSFLHPQKRPPFAILGIETSCDETAASVVLSDGSILSEVVYSQWDLFRIHHGVVPHLAARRHKENLPKVVASAITQSGKSIHEIDAIALTVGPGLAPCLSEGRLFVQQFAQEHKKLVFPINHLEAHALIAQISQRSFSDQAPLSVLEYPFLSVLVSGGHTQLSIANAFGSHDTLGVTLDDAIGEAYDKAARLLELDLLPGESAGRALERIASEGKPVFSLPDSLLRVPGFCFSYSGLKSAFRRQVESLNLKTLHDEEKKRCIADLTASFQRAAIRHIEQRLQRGLKWCKQYRPELRQLVLCGGVAGNKSLQAVVHNLAQKSNFELLCPNAIHCTDNATMIAWAGVHYYWTQFKGSGELPRVVPVGEPNPLFPIETEWSHLATRAKWSLGKLVMI